MRVAHIVPVAPPYGGGMGRLAFGQARALAAAGVEVTLIVPEVARPPAPVPGVRVLPLRPLFAKGNAACLPALPRHAGDYDLLHLHYPFFGTAELVAARRLLGGPPVVLQYHMDVVGRGWLGRAFRWHRRLLFPLVLRAADAVVVTSLDYAAASFLADSRQALPPRTWAIPPGVDLRRFSVTGERHPALVDFAAGRRLVFFLAALDPAHYFKGLDVLLRAMTTMPADVALVIGGDGVLRSSYSAHVAQLGLTQRVLFLGYVPDAVLPSAYRAADVLVLPSVDRTEAFGLVLLEAMACGKPVVASRLPGVRTVVAEGRSGYLAAPGNPSDLADKLTQTLSAGPELGAYAREWVEERFSWHKVGGQLLDLYQDIANFEFRISKGTKADR